MKIMFNEGCIAVRQQDLSSFREDVLKYLDLNASSKKWITTTWDKWYKDIFVEVCNGYLPRFVFFDLKKVRKVDICVRSYEPAKFPLSELPLNKEISSKCRKHKNFSYLIAYKRLKGDTVQIYERGKVCYREDSLMRIYHDYYSSFYKPLHKKVYNPMNLTDFLQLSIRVNRAKVEFVSGDYVVLGVTKEGVAYNGKGYLGTIEMRYNYIFMDGKKMYLNKVEETICTVFKGYLGLKEIPKDMFIIDFFRGVKVIK